MATSRCSRISLEKEGEKLATNLGDSFLFHHPPRLRLFQGPWNGFSEVTACFWHTSKCRSPSVGHYISEFHFSLESGNSFVWHMLFGLFMFIFNFLAIYTKIKKRLKMTEKNDRTELMHLEKENELQFTIRQPGDKLTVQLISGSAEIFGSELQINQRYEFRYFSSVSIFTWDGCTLEITKEASLYIRYQINQSTQIPKMWDLHKYLEEMRVNADVNKSDYPITLLTGPTDVGKSTLCRYLLNSAAKRERKSIFLDLDVGQGSLSIPGTFAVLPVNEPSDVNGRFDEEAMSVYFFGYKSPGHNMSLYELLIEKLGRRLKNRLRAEKQASISGVFIDTCGWVDGPGYKLLKKIVELLNVNMVLVLSDSSLHSKLKHDVSPRIKILHVDSFSEVAVRNKSVRRDNRDKAVYEYFYGSSNRLKPYRIKIHFNDLQIFKASSCPAMNDSYGSKSDDFNASNVVSILIEPDILYQVLGLSYADHIENIPITSVYGFICIVEIDMNSEFVTVLSPRPGPLPTKYFLMGDVKLP